MNYVRVHAQKVIFFPNFIIIQGVYYKVLLWFMFLQSLRGGHPDLLFSIAYAEERDFSGVSVIPTKYIVIIMII